MTVKTRREQEVKDSFRVIARWEKHTHRKVEEFHRVFSSVMNKCLSGSVEWEMYFRPSPDSLYEKMNSFASAHPWIRAKKIISTRLFYKGDEQWCEISYRSYSTNIFAPSSGDKHSWSEPVSLLARSDRDVATLARVENLRFKQMLAKHAIDTEFDKQKKLIDIMRQCQKRREENTEDIEVLRKSVSKLSQQIAEKTAKSTTSKGVNAVSSDVDWTIPTHL